MCLQKNSLKVYYNNINGLLSKLESLKQVIKVCTPDIVALCETKLGALSKPKIDGYEIVYRNFKRGKEGLLVAAKVGTFTSIEKVSVETDESDEKNVLAVLVKYPSISLRVIVGHAPQETANPDARERFFESLKVEVERGQLNGDKIVVMGDMNGRIEQENDVNVIKASVGSPNGLSLKMFLDEHRLHVANFHPDTVGEWTRIQKSNKGEKKSSIDYVILEEETYDELMEMIIDEAKMYTPYWITKKKKEKCVTFSDHCAIITTIHAVVGDVTESDEEPQKRWKVTTAGLEKYNGISAERTLFFDNKNPTDMYNQWWDHVENTLKKCFKKVALKTQDQKFKKNSPATYVRSVLTKIARRGRVQREVVQCFKKKLIEWECKALENARVDRLKETLSHFSEDDRTPPNAYWKVLKSVRGKEKTKISSVLKNDGVEVFSKDQIKNEILGEFKNRLRNRKPSDGWEAYVESTNELVDFLMSQKVVDGADFTLEELMAAIKVLKKRKAPGPDEITSEFLIEAGEGILLPLLELFNEIKKSKDPPEQWNSVLIAIIYKNKGSRKSLVNYRGIFLASVVSKVFERLLKNRIKSHMAKVNLCQAGARSNRGPPDNTFILNAVIDHCIYLGKSLHLTAYDFEQAFDSLWLQDCILALKNLDIPDYILQLVYKLNRTALISVKTQFGPTATAMVEDTVQQGRVLAPDLCSASTGEYCGRNKGVAVGTCIISSLAFVDDMLDMSQNHNDAEAAHLNATVFSRQKKMRYSLPKCEGMLVNGKKDDKLPVMKLEGKAIKHSPQIKYIGDIFQQNGTNHLLIKERLGRGTTVMLKIDAIMSETQFGKHTIDVYLLLYGALYLNSVIFNSQAWRNLTDKNYEQLQVQQLKLLRKVVDAPSFISSSFLFLELGVLPIKYEINARQISFLHHVVNLSADDPVSVLYEHMKRLPFEKNWLCEVTKLAQKYNINIDEDHLRTTSKDSFKCQVKQAIREYAFQSLLQECESKSKTKEVVYSQFRTQPYLSKLYPSHAKTILKCRSRCLKIKNHRPFQFNNTLCRWCYLQEESLEHIVNCGWQEETLVNTNVMNNLDNMDPKVEAELIAIATRVSHFLELVDY